MPTLMFPLLFKCHLLTLRTHLCLTLYPILSLSHPVKSYFFAPLSMMRLLTTTPSSPSLTISPCLNSFPDCPLLPLGKYLTNYSSQTSPLELLSIRFPLFLLHPLIP